MVLSADSRRSVAALWPGAQIILAAIAVFCVPFALFYSLVLYHFYVRGGFLLDTGLLGSLMWHNSWALTMPPSMGGHSYLAIHFTPLLSLLSAVSWVSPLTMPRFFACFIGLSHGLLACAMLWLLVEGHGMRRGWALGLATLASGAFAFNGLAVAIVRYPHYEMFGADCLLLCFIALVLKRPWIASVSLLFALATREDVGFHAFGFLTVWLAVNWLRGVRREQNARLMGYAAAALTYSIAALALQHFVFPGPSALVRVYLGEPAFSHISWDFLAMHAFGWIKIHSAIYLPLAAALLWAERTRDPFLLVGYAACVPWTVLHLFAVSDYAGWMVGYYAYPFVVAMAWPLLAVATPADRAPAASLRPCIYLMVTVALSLLPLSPDFDPGKIPLPGAFFHAPTAEQQRMTDNAINAIAAARPLLGRLVVDRSVAGLAPLTFTQAEVAAGEETQANTIVFFEDGFDAATLRSTPNLPVYYAVPGTPIRIMTDRPATVTRQIAVQR
jgi:hypothetical protein